MMMALEEKEVWLCDFQTLNLLWWLFVHDFRYCMVSKTGGDDPSTYRDVPMGKMFKYDSLGTTLRAPKEDQNI